MRPLIGLTVGRDLPDQPSYLRLRATYPAAVEAAGGVPVLVPPLTDPAALRELFERLDGLVLPGGLDVHPRHYGDAETHPTTEVDDVLDELELRVARWAAETDVPTLGICRGQQLLNVALGGSLVQDLPSEGFLQTPHRQSGARDALTHTLELAGDSRLAGILGERRFAVNSFHHQAVRAVAPGLRAVGWSDDGLVEAVEGTDHPWLVAVQFHPEDLVGSHGPSRRLFGALVEACKQRAARRSPYKASQTP